MIGQAVMTALRSIWSKKTRSFLTMLGVIIGVSQIVALTGLGNGIKKDVSSQVTQLGSNILFVLPGKVQGSNGSFNPTVSIGASTLTEQDVLAIKQVPNITAVIPFGLIAGVPAVGDRQAFGTLVMASDANILDFLKTYKVINGHFFSAADEASKAKVIVISKDAAGKLYPNVSLTDVIGKETTLGKNTFTIVGVMDQTQTTPTFAEAGNSGGGLAVIPFTTAKDINSNTQIFRIGVQADANTDVKAMKKILTAKLKELHGVEDTTVFTQDDILKVVNNILGLITTAIVALASISLIVGGIGIMNIMLVAVSERTKEIGLRKALGATRGVILMQFLTESAIISLFGGAVGVAIVSIVSIIVKAQANLSIVINLNSILVAVGFSLGVGIIFGLLPALRAASKDPIDALRYE